MLANKCIRFLAESWMRNHLCLYGKYIKLQLAAGGKCSLALSEKQKKKIIHLPAPLKLTK